MENIVVFGGSFNPPTKAHLALGLQALKFINGSKLCFVPVGDKYRKDSLINAKYRVDMLNILKENNDGYSIDVDLTEVNSKENLNTIDTLRILQDKYKDSTLYFLLGADNLLCLTEWQEPEELLKNYKILAIKRDGYSIKDIVANKSLLNKYKKNIIPIDIKEEMFISSTMVRELIQNEDDSVGNYIDENVKKYIEENKLYKKL